MIATVLVIEDDMTTRRLIAATLAKAEYRVIEAADGQQGLESLLSEPPDLILCDRIMPVMSGYDLLAAVRAHHREIDATPFVFLTSLDDPRDRQSVADLHPTDYWEKPIDPRDLLRRVRALLGGEVPLGA